MYLVNPPGRCSLGLEIRSISVADLALLKVSEVFNLEDLELPIFLDESENEDTFVVDLGALGGSEQGRMLEIATYYDLRWRDGVERDKRERQLFPVLQSRRER